MRRPLGAYMLLLTGFIACPCHLLLTLPVVMGLLGGTALGVWLSTHTGLVYGLSSGYFLAALIVGFWWLNRMHSTGSPAGGASGPPQPASREHPASMDGRHW